MVSWVFFSKMVLRWVHFYSWLLFIPTFFSHGRLEVLRKSLFHESFPWPCQPFYDTFFIGNCFIHWISHFRAKVQSGLSDDRDALLMEKEAEVRIFYIIHILCTQLLSYVAKEEINYDNLHIFVFLLCL